MSTETDRLLEIVARLRDPDDGCPWDVEQTFQTIAPHTIEEAYEVADAIAEGDMDGLKGELGDLLFQVVFHARMASEAGAFGYEDVARAIADKMVKRHPHVFGDASVADAEAQTRAWEEQKAAERAEQARSQGRRPSHLDGVTRGLPALTRAVKLQNRAARVGFDWPDAAPILDKVREELDEVAEEVAAERRDPARLADELGDLLFTCVNLARKLGVDPEAALRGTNAKFERRFRRVEQDLNAAGTPIEDADLDTMEAAWQAAKQHDKG